MRRITAGLVALGCTIASARSLHAQAEGWLAALTTPPRSVGTCMAPTPTTVGVIAAMTRYRLVMVSLTPGRRREISVSLDSSGRPRLYNEMSMANTGAMTSTGDIVFASIDIQGHVRGTRSHSTTKITGSMPARGDTAALRKWMAEKRHSVSENTQEPLDSADQRTVVALAKWLVARCK